MLKDLGDKVKADDKTKVEDEVKKAKAVLEKTDLKRDDYDKAAETLSQIIQTVGAALYQQQQPDPNAPKTDDSAKGGSAEEAGKKDAEEGEIVK